MIRDYTLTYVSEIIEFSHELKGKLIELGSYTDKNFLIDIGGQGSSGKFIIKISSTQESRPRILLQNYVLKQLQNHKFDFKCQFPRIKPTQGGSDMTTITSPNGTNIIRVFSYIEGEQVYDLEDPPAHLFDQAGELTAHLSIFFNELSSKAEVIELIPENSGLNHQFNLLTFNQHYQKHYQHLDAHVAIAVDKIKQQFNQFLPILKEIPKQLVHHDICLTNLLVAKSQQNEELFISGLIDFSDIIYTHGIIELVILCARINLYQPQPLRNMLRVIKAYNKIRKLTEMEKKVLFPMIKTRLAFLCLTSSSLAAEKENDPYFQKCKNGHISYLMTFFNICTNSQFIQLLEAQTL